MTIRSLFAAAALALSAPVLAQPATLIGALERLAATGNAEALYHLGMSYQTGSGVAVDHGRALGYFRRAAALGDPLAHYKLGCFYDGQDGVVPVDAAKALSEKLVAAEAGYALAQQDVAVHYARSGDLALAERWIVKAAAQGWPDAMLAYAALRSGKLGLPRDGAVSVAYLTLALRQAPAADPLRAELAKQRTALTRPDRVSVDRIVATYRATPTALTLSALSGQRAAQALIDRQGKGRPD